MKTQPDSPETADTNDYTEFDTVINIPAGRTTASVTMVIDDDAVVEDDTETFELVLDESPDTLPPCVLDPANKLADVTITDNDCKSAPQTEYVHFRSHAGYFLLLWKIPEAISRRSMLYHN